MTSELDNLRQRVEQLETENATLRERLRSRRLRIPSEVETQWARAYKLPPPGNMMQSHKNAERAFVEQGTRMYLEIVGAIKRHCKKEIAHCSILDFGCGVGRIALPFYYHFQKPDAAVDVDQKTVDYLKSTIPALNVRCTSNRPPLPFPDNAFDVIYAISVWTHLSPDMGETWLREMKRIVKPDGICLISIHGIIALERLRDLSIPRSFGWDKVQLSDLRKRGFVFTSQNTAGTYGLIAHDPDWIMKEWASIFSVVAIEQGRIEEFQDLCVLQNSRP